MKKDDLHKGHYMADEGKVILPKVRENDECGTKSIWLSSWDSIDNYEEIDEPKEPEEELDKSEA